MGGKEAFEWYGTYPQLCHVFHKYMNPRDNILMAGCGNSTLSADLYNAGFKSIMNVDISDKVIQQMNQLYSKTHPDMKFMTMDLLNLEFSPGTFSCFLDKGTLDALMSENSDESRKRAISMFEEIDKVLKIGGRYICISLLQDHILQCLMSHFHNLGWMIRVCRCEEAEAQEEKRFSFPVFAIICTKFKKMERITPILEYCPNEKTNERLSGLEEMLNRIKSVQHFSSFCHQIGKDSSASEDVSIELMDPKSSIKTAKYTLFIVDRRSKSPNKFAAFIVPLGRETDWLYSSSEGRRELAASAKFQRLIVVHLGRDHQFPSLEHIQQELSSVVSSLQPKDLPPNTQIPFLSLGTQVDHRKEIHRDQSASTGEYVIEEVEEDDDAGKKTLLRRLIFLSNPNVIQSEARLSKGKVDLKYLACQHHHVMVEILRSSLEVPSFTKRVAVLGLGGGALCTYLHHAFPSLTIDGVEIDPVMVHLAKKYFGFTPSSNLRAHVADAYQFIQELASDSDRERYGCIMLDVDCKDRTLGLSCPPPNFVELSFIDSIKRSLAPGGVFLLNLVCRDQTIRSDVMSILREAFEIVQVTKIKNEVNEIVKCYSSMSSLKTKISDAK